jgi:hypothetical protein
MRSAATNRKAARPLETTPQKLWEIKRPTRADRAACSGCAHDRRSGNRRSLRWRWLSPVLAVEVSKTSRQAAPRIHGELLKLGIDVGQTSVAKYMPRRRRPPSQGWRTFLLNHPDGIASIDLFMVPTISFRLLCGLLVLRHDRRRILWLGVTAHPTAEWTARQGHRGMRLGERAPLLRP